MTAVANGTVVGDGKRDGWRMTGKGISYHSGDEDLTGKSVSQRGFRNNRTLCENFYPL